MNKRRDFLKKTGYGAAHGIGGSGTHHITIRGCNICFIGGGHQMTRPYGEPVRYGNGIEFWSNARDCVVEDCRLWEIYDAALTSQGDGTNVQENINYRHNVIWNSDTPSSFGTAVLPAGRATSCSNPTPAWMPAMAGDIGNVRIRTGAI